VKIDANEIRKKLQGPTDRVRKAVYVSEKIWTDFERSCGVSMSKVIEELMRQFSATTRRKRS